MIVRGLAVVVLASSLGGCSHVGAMWSRLTNHHGEEASAAAPAASVQGASPQVCDTLRNNASTGTTADPASRQMAIDEMKRINCADIPAP